MTRAAVARSRASTATAVTASRATVAALADPQMLKGRRRGNIVFAASNGPLTGGGARRDALVRHLLSDPLPTRLVEPLDDFTAGARPCGEPLQGS